MPLNAVRFGAKCSAFCCKTQGKMQQNAMLNATKCKTKSIKIHRYCINKTFQSHENRTEKGKIAIKK